MEVCLLVHVDVRAAFEGAYKSDSRDHFLEYIDKHTPRLGSADNFYNRSLSIVQSSGMGKSRLVDHCAQLRFTIPFNLRESLPDNSHGLSSPQAYLHD
ncbi:MAG TPA: hypothetical protein VGO47_08335 [Chlamydiales bacterium]|nr:hypothetical protein [Chlamydiales bacterium]